MKDNNLLNLERKIRINTNRMICYIAEGKSADLYADEWRKTREDIEKNLGKDNVYYANNLLIDAWYAGILMGDEHNAIQVKRKYESILQNQRDHN